MRYSEYWGFVLVAGLCAVNVYFGVQEGLPFTWAAAAFSGLLSIWMAVQARDSRG